MEAGALRVSLRTCADNRRAGNDLAGGLSLTLTRVENAREAHVSTSTARWMASRLVGTYWARCRPSRCSSGKNGWPSTQTAVLVNIGLPRREFFDAGQRERPPAKFPPGGIAHRANNFVTPRLPRLRIKDGLVAGQDHAPRRISHLQFQLHLCFSQVIFRKGQPHMNLGYDYLPSGRDSNRWSGPRSAEAGTRAPASSHHAVPVMPLREISNQRRTRRHRRGSARCNPARAASRRGYP